MGLLSRALGGEAGVPFLSVAGTEFTEVFHGVGASRVRDMFEVARKNSPCILFIDELDSIGKSRENSTTENSGSDVATINQLLTELDSFENNDGILVKAATNRPGALDEALTRLGRFDRVITMGLPEINCRVDIFHVHARGKKIAKNVDWLLIARASSGFSGAEIMSVMNVAATISVQAQESFISQEAILDSIEKVLMERTHTNAFIREDTVDDEIISSSIKRRIAIYTAAKGLVAYITPFFVEVTKITCCYLNQLNGQVYFVFEDEQVDLNVTNRPFLESRLVMLLAGQVAEKLVLGQNYHSCLGDTDSITASFLVRDMVFKFGFGKRIGPSTFTQEQPDYLRTEEQVDPLVGIDPITTGIGAADMEDIFAAAESKAYYGLVNNYRGLEALSSLLDHKSSVGKSEIDTLLKNNGVKSYSSCSLSGFSFDPDMTRLEGAPHPIDWKIHEQIENIKEQIKGQIKSEHVIGKHMRRNTSRIFTDI